MHISPFDHKIQSRFSDIVRRLKGEPNCSKTTNEWRYGSNGSLSVIVGGPKAGTWYDHERQLGGGVWDFLYIEGDMQREAAEEWLARELGIRRDSETVISYVYVDERGKTLFWVKRKGHGDGKRIWQEQPGEGRGGIRRKPDGKPDMAGARMVPYHLDELVTAAALADGKPWAVLIVEGEKSADRLREQWHARATCSPRGAGKWRSEYNRYFAGADAIVLADNDDTGRKHAVQVARALCGVAAQVRIVELPGLAEKGDVWDWMEDGASQSDLETLIEATELFNPQREDNDDGSLAPEGQPAVRWVGANDEPIPPRRWLLGTTFCRGYLSGLIGAGGTGKTALRTLQLIALALGRSDLADEKVFHRTKVLLVCLEDDEDEVRRRIRAACLHHGIDERELNGWLFYWTPHDLRLLEVDQHGNAEPGALGDALRHIIKRLGIGLVSVDPFVKSHGAGENDNAAIDKAAGLLLQIAYDCDCACDYVHHSRKGIPLAGDADSARGASALVNASRSVKTAVRMTKEEAAAFGIEDAERQSIIRIDDAKLNIAPPAEATVWFKLVSVNIGNATPEYPGGDNVQTVERWYPPDIWKDFTIATANKILDRIAEGPEPGRRYSGAKQAKRAAWIVVQEFCPKLNDEQAQKVINTWLDTGVLRNEPYDDPKEHREQLGLTVGKRPGDTWER